jgi:hypothetical protein
MMLLQIIKMKILVDAMRGGENVLISDEDSATVLVRLVTKQSRHPGPLARVGWLTTHNPDGLLHQLTTTCVAISFLISFLISLFT